MKGQKAAAEKHAVNYCRVCLERVEYRDAMYGAGWYAVNLDGTQHECKGEK